ncbi:MAG TPA: c-type cytochrome [Burkholderiaceae bacterium]|nr:c-type cytochrome [Burkholderiaceae bacterium]
MTSTEEHKESHESFIKTPRQLIVTIILAFLIPIIIIIMLVHMVVVSTPAGAGSDADSTKTILARIQPVASLKLVDANAPKTYLTGKQVFDSTCTACHTAGVAGAPKVGNKADWAPFIKTGYQEMIKNAIHGVGAMPPKGGNASLSDYEVARAIAYMANQSGASFKEPPPPAPASAKKVAAAAVPAPVVAATAPAAAAPAQPAAEPAKAAAQPAAEPAKAAPAPIKVAAIPGLAPDAATNPEGEKLYKTVCFACHATGVMGAPTFGSMEKWGPFIKTGIDTMVKNAIHGVGNMPPRGGSQATDAQMRAGVEYMVSHAK